MFQNYIVTAQRSLWKYKQYTMINIIGLAVGLAACILILLYVDFERSYDRWIPENDRVMRLETTLYSNAGEYAGHQETTPPVTGPLFAEQIPEIEVFARFLFESTALAYEGRAFEQEVTLTDPGIFELMGVRLLEGNAETALSTPDTLVLSQSDAKRIFGDVSALGKTVKIDGQHLVRVTGVMPDWPKNSDLNVRALVPFSSPIIAHMPWLQTNWGSFWGPTYVRLAKGADPEAVSQAINELALRIGPANNFKQRVEQGIKPSHEFGMTLAKEAHLESTSKQGGARGSNANLIAAGVIALLILVIAVINVTNLGTMLAMKRVREVSIRKALGAEAKHLMVQILVESIALTLLAVLIGIAFAEALLPTFSELMSRPLDSDPLYQFDTLALLGMGTLVVGVVSGLYPALVATHFRPVDYLNGIKPSVGSKFRNSLIVMQFAATIGLLSTCLVVFMQAEHAKNRDPGFNSSQMMEISGIERPVVLKREAALREALGRIRGVEAVAASHGMPGHQYNNNNNVQVDNGTSTALRRFAVSEDLFQVLGVQPIAGRLFDKNRPSDLVVRPTGGTVGAIVLNELAVAQLGFTTPEEAIGHEVRTMGDRRYTIIGVVPTLHTRSAKEEPRATYFWYGPNEFRHIVMQVSRADMEQTLSEIGRVWREFFPELPIRQQFLDDAFASYYDTERRQGWLLFFSATVMTIIAVMGLYGLAALATERRAREIGIRKVLGARSFNIVQLLLWQFSTPVLVANIIAWPLAWWALSGWLDGFIERIGLTPLPFIAAGLLVLTIAWITIAGHTLRVARSNPIKALRYE